MPSDDDAEDAANRNRGFRFLRTFGNRGPAEARRRLDAEVSQVFQEIRPILEQGQRTRAGLADFIREAQRRGVVDVGMGVYSRHMHPSSSAPSVTDTAVAPEPVPTAPHRRDSPSHVVLNMDNRSPEGAVSRDFSAGVEASGPSAGVLGPVASSPPVPPISSEPAAAAAGDSPNNNNSPDDNIVTVPDEVRGIVESVGKYVPYLGSLFILFIFNHLAGLLIFTGLMITFTHGNAVVKREVARQAKRNIVSLMPIVVNLITCIFFIYYVFWEDRLYYHLFFLVTDRMPSTWDNLIWTVLVTDFTAKLVTILIKVCIVALPSGPLPFQKRGKWYLFVERCSQLYRCVLPFPVWFQYYFQVVPSLWAGYTLGVVYVCFKCREFIGEFRKWRRALTTFLTTVRARRKLDLSLTLIFLEIMPLQSLTYGSQTRAYKTQWKHDIGKPLFFLDRVHGTCIVAGGYTSATTTLPDSVRFPSTEKNRIGLEDFNFGGNQTWIKEPPVSIEFSTETGNFGEANEGQDSEILTSKAPILRFGSATTVAAEEKIASPVKKGASDATSEEPAANGTPVATSEKEPAANGTGPEANGTSENGEKHEEKSVEAANGHTEKKDEEKTEEAGKEEGAGDAAVKRKSEAVASEEESNKKQKSDDAEVPTSVPEEAAKEAETTA
ncbi:unnamed protein product [Cyprideis torosa]|uniref:Uncharacterized protein n=1 Tax=Cyprideis torosa TaxID=163714 RepID=A0A7R8W1B9_9CRUS|nr:unnamed protein product [Cyprideis torosa]CAG0880750.1 unnamed protein product [Cyprideis torosa]